MTIKAIVYARVSTDDQADKGFSLAAQVEAGRKYAETHAMTVSQELIDDGVSGAMAFSERPAGATAWALLRSGKAHALIVQNVDRLSRDVVDLLVTVRELLRAGVEVHCLDLGRVTSEYDIMLVIRGWQGSDERAKIRERSMRGKREKLAQGMVISGVVPYGYQYLRDDKGRIVNLEIVPEQAQVVNLLFDWYTQEGLTMHAIAQKLTAAGIAKPRKSKSLYWHNSTVKRIIDNATYKGVSEYTLTGDDGSEQTFGIAVPAIIDTATWDAAQVQRGRNKRKSTRNANREYLLRGIITCGCGYSMVGKSQVTGGKRYYYYTCSVRCHKSERTCNELSIHALELEAATWAALRDRLEHAETLEADMRESQRREDAEREPKTTELDAVNGMLKEAQADADKLARTLSRLDERGQAEGAVGGALQRQIDEVNQRHSDLAARREVLEAELSQRRVTDEAITRTVTYTEGARVGLDHATNEDKRVMLDTFNGRVTVTDGKPKLALWMPDEVIIDLQLPRQSQHNYRMIEIDLLPYLAIVSARADNASAQRSRSPRY